MDIKVYVEEADGSFRTVEAPTDMNLSLMELLKASDYPIAATCGGMALCATCHVEVLEGDDFMEATDPELDIFDTLPVVPKGSRLSCQMRITEQMEGIKIRLLASEE
ncbi:MAG: 2Fe-2S iron-sulfur cluster-binding protein [Cyclobacteriaceae bacterium]